MTGAGNSRGYGHGARLRAEAVHREDTNRVTVQSTQCLFLKIYVIMCPNDNDIDK